MVGNRRYLLRAYETPDSARLAHLLIGMRAPTVTRDRVVDEWTTRRPADAARRSIRKRVNYGAHLLSVIQAIHREGHLITVVDRDRLAMVARNLEVLENQEGYALPPSQWLRRPEAPADLRDIQDELERTRTA